jgi:PAS domain S-box-containing protein
VDPLLSARAAEQTLFIEQMPAHVAVFDHEMHYLAVSQRFLSDMAFLFSTKVLTPAEVIGRSHYETFPNMPSRWRDFHGRVLAGEELTQEEDFLTRENGRAEWTRWSMKPWRTADGRISGVLLFSEVITQQVEASHALAESEVRFRATFENAAVGIAHLTCDLKWLRANKALCCTLGYSVDELVTKSLREITHPDDHAGNLAHIERMRRGKIDSYEVEKRYLRRDGTVVWGKATVSCVRKNDGSIDYLVAVIQDISGRKRAEEQIHLLTREVNHRAKNVLSLVQAIAYQTAAREPKDFIERFTERIRALAANQNLLVRNEWRGVDIDDLAHAHLAPFADLIGTRITVDGPKLHLNVAATQAIGLALHELTTNAGKYGALSTEAGRVGVRWEIADNDAFTVSWTERDGPPVFPPERRGFGTEVIEAMPKHNVGGVVELDYATSGVTWRLTCPAVNVLEGTAKGE